VRLLGCKNSLNDFFLGKCGQNNFVYWGFFFLQPELQIDQLFKGFIHHMNQTVFLE